MATSPDKFHVFSFLEHILSLMVDTINNQGIESHLGKQRGCRRRVSKPIIAGVIGSAECTDVCVV